MRNRLLELSLRPRTFLLAATLALVGCNSKVAENATKETDPETSSLFQKGKGISLPDGMRKEFGLEVVEVVEKSLPRHVTKAAQVYRAALDGDPAGASLFLSADEAKALKPGQPVNLQPAHGIGPLVTGKLVRLDEHALSVLGQVEALIEFSDAERRFAAGTFLTASFLTREAKPVFVVPETALLACANGSFVYTVNGKHLTRTAVKTGAASDGFVEIENGLYAGDSVAAKGVDNLWFIELSALKGGTPCCPAPKKDTGK